jgi:hypothetical protein
MKYNNEWQNRKEAAAYFKVLSYTVFACKNLGTHEYFKSGYPTPRSESSLGTL